MKIILTATIALAVCSVMGQTNQIDANHTKLSHMTTSQKVQYAKQLRETSCLGAALDTLTEAVEDLVKRQNSKMDPRRYAESICATNIVVSTTNEVCVMHVEIIEIRNDETKEQLIRRLAKEGHICEVLGHVWESIPHITLKYLPDGEYPTYRKCQICGKIETKQPGEWK